MKCAGCQKAMAQPYKRTEGPLVNGSPTKRRPDSFYCESCWMSYKTQDEATPRRLALNAIRQAKAKGYAHLVADEIAEHIAKFGFTEDEVGQ